MAGVPSLDFEVYWKNESEAIRAAYKEVMASQPLAKAAVEEVYDVIKDIKKLAGYMHEEMKEIKEWANIVKRSEASRASLCGTLEGETLFSALTEFL
jgi:hypothetical protein